MNLPLPQSNAAVNAPDHLRAQQVSIIRGASAWRVAAGHLCGRYWCGRTVDRFNALGNGNRFLDDLPVGRPGRILNYHRSSLLGGYLAGRLWTKWISIHSHETYFRDTAHGFLARAVVTLVIATLLSSAITSFVDGGLCELVDLYPLSVVRRQIAVIELARQRQPRSAEGSSAKYVAVVSRS